MKTHFHCMPVDRTTIKTRLAIHPDLFDDPNGYIRERTLNVRTSKLTRGMCKHGPTQNLTLDVLRYKGIKAKLTKVSDEPLTEVTIDFNPGVCLHGDNGATLSLREFLDALGLLETSLTPFLSNPDDSRDLVPGHRIPGVAYWDFLEILLQHSDPGGKILAGFRHAQRSNPNTVVRHWANSIQIGGKKSALQFAIYFKAAEMVERSKLPRKKLPDYEDILRLEVRLKGKKLVHYMGNSRNLGEIDGVSRLVQFYPRDLVEGHRKSFSELLGVFKTHEPVEPLNKKDQLTPLGRILAQVALDPRTSMTFPELLSRIRSYTGAHPDTIKAIRKAGLEIITSQSALNEHDIFSDVAYQRHRSVRSEASSEKVRHDMDDAAPNPWMCKAYVPPDQASQLMVPIPSYHRW